MVFDRLLVLSLVRMQFMKNLGTAEYSAKQKFYLNNIKVVPHDIYWLLDGVALAHWAMCDGSRTSSGGFVFCTDAFTVKETTQLINVLILRFNQECTLQNKVNRIYIKTTSFPLFVSIVKPHFVPFFMYK